MEWTRYIGPDGAVYNLTVPSAYGRWVIGQSGWGTPPIDYITVRGTQQHGATVKDYFLLPRTIQLLIKQGYCSRSEYWTGRAGILDAIRPNRQPTGEHAPGILELTWPDGSVRRLDVYIADGPRFEPSELGRWDEWAFREVLRFTAFDPIIYDPAEQTVSFVAGDELVFPITFPITFSDIAQSGVANYLGTWEDYPTIEITGPITGPSITNVDTGETITLDYAVPAGDVVTISLRGDKLVTDQAGANLIGTVNPASDLASFHIAPDPEAPGGVNTINVAGSGTTPATSIVVTYINRYFGI